jgi:hypothetical protein
MITTHQAAGEFGHCLNLTQLIWVHILMLHSILKLHITVEFDVLSFCCEFAPTWPVLEEDTTA